MGFGLAAQFAAVRLLGPGSAITGTMAVSERILPAAVPNCTANVGMFSVFYSLELVTTDPLRLQHYLVSSGPKHCTIMIYHPPHHSDPAGAS